MHTNRSVHFRKRRVLLAAAVGIPRPTLPRRRFRFVQRPARRENLSHANFVRSFQNVHHVALVVPFRAVVVKSIELRVARRRNNVRADVTKLHHFCRRRQNRSGFGCCFLNEGGVLRCWY